MDLDGYAPKSVHEFSEKLIVWLLQTDQGGRGDAIRFVGCILGAEAFDGGVKTIYGPRWESTVPSQCRPLEGRWEDTT